VARSMSIKISDTIGNELTTFQLRRSSTDSKFLIDAGFFMIIASVRDKVLRDMLKYLLSNMCSLYLCTNAIVSD